MSNIHSSKSFSLVEETLAAALSAEQVKLPTANSFAADRHTLQRSLAASVGIDTRLPVLLISDGVSKNSGCGELSADDLLVQLLDGEKLLVEKISLAELLGVEPFEVHASVSAVASLAKHLSNRHAAAVVVLGSGSVTDIVKHALFELSWNETPFIVVPTALTVTAFTSHFAVLEESGAKRTRLSRRVDHCLWFAPVLAAAPASMTRAGYGDLLARFVAYGDWYLAWRFGVAARYDELAFRLMEPFSNILKKSAPELNKWPVSHAAAEELSATLAMAGIAMSVSGETTPLSGYEHTISHALDYLRLTSRRPLCWHGEQVALASLSSAESFDQLLALEKIDVHSHRPATAEQVKRIIRQLLVTAPYYGAAEAALTAEERKRGLESLQEDIDRACEIFTADYLKKNELWIKAQEKHAEIEEQWPATRAHLRTLVISADEMRSLLVQSGLPVLVEQLSQPTSALEYRWAIRFSPFVRARASLSDIIFWLGEDPALWAIV
ncbi:MAG: hypothetical protein RLZZ488_1644 [Pseudomonadota bacterium]|jgi:glycerol-1-phosphate dehydrogenase [NAD(P)+]